MRGLNGRLVGSLEDAVEGSAVEEKLYWREAREVDLGHVQINKW